MPQWTHPHPPAKHNKKHRRKKGHNKNMATPSVARIGWWNKKHFTKGPRPRRLRYKKSSTVHQLHNQNIKQGQCSAPFAILWVSPNKELHTHYNYSHLPTHPRNSLRLRVPSAIVGPTISKGWKAHNYVTSKYPPPIKAIIMVYLLEKVKLFIWAMKRDFPFNPGWLIGILMIFIMVYCQCLL